MSHKGSIVTRHILWQAVLALLGIALIFFVVFQLATTVAPAPPEVVTVEVRAAGGAYVEGVLGFSDTINPIYSARMVPSNPVDQDLSTLVFDGLTVLDETGRLAPALASEWDVSDDGMQYEFRLREDVLWHDGAPFTAADVAFTVQAMQDPDYQGDPSLGELWRNVTVEQLDPHAVRFTLAEPFPSFLQYTIIGMLPAHLLGNVAAADLLYHDFSTRNPVGTGMFMVDEANLEPGDARAEVNRYTQSPTQPMSYLMGKYEIMQIVDEYKKKFPDHSLKQMHDAILNCGSLPPRLMRQKLFG